MGPAVHRMNPNTHGEAKSHPSAFLRKVGVLYHLRFVVETELVLPTTVAESEVAANSKLLVQFSYCRFNMKTRYVDIRLQNKFAVYEVEQFCCKS